MSSVDKRCIAELQSYIGKTYYNDFNSIEILSLFGGEIGSPFFLCRVDWSEWIFTADPLEVLPFFDDQKQPYDDYNVADVQ